MLGPNAIRLFNIKECLDRIDDIENGHICPGFSQAFSKCQTTSPRAASDQCSPTFEGKLGYQ